MGFLELLQNDALAKARGEPTQGFHNIQPNYSNPEIIAAVADKKAGRSTKFYDTGVPNVWQQYADKESKKQAASPTPEPKTVEPAPEPVRASVKAKKKGTTIISSPLATKSQGGSGAAYKKRLLGD